MRSTKQTSHVGVTLIESVVAIGVVGLFVIIFSSSFTYVTFRQYIRDRDRAMHLSQEEIEAIKDSTFTKIASWSGSNFMGVAYNKGKWAVQSSGDAASSPNIYALSSPSPTQTGVSGLAVLPGGDYDDATYEVSLRAKSDSPANWQIGLDARYVDLNNFYRVVFTSTAITLSKTANGTESTLYTENRSFNLDQWYKVKIVASGTALQLWLDDVQLTTQTDSSHVRGKLTLTGINSVHGEFDNVTVTTGSTTTWNFDSDTVGLRPIGWERFGIHDLHGGADVLAIEDAITGFSDIKKVTATVQWQYRGTTRSVQLVTYVFEQNVP